MSDVKRDIITGSVAGTGAAINVSIGFKPSYVKVYNHTAQASMEWWSGMTAANGLRTRRIVDSGATGNASIDGVTSAGISQYAPSVPDGGIDGFTIGADAVVNINANTLYYIAIR